tara:strand:+ start:243 stop:1556 length:1314 start_codon:yes stop_codon:yes gene_type:complete
MRFSKILTLSLLFLIYSVSVFATELKVYPNALAPDYSNIQDAVDAASDGDIIYIDTMTYIGNVTISDKAISLYPMRDEGMYTINGDLTIYINHNETVYIQGLSGGSVNVYDTGSGGTNTSQEFTRKIIFNGCYFSSTASVYNYVLAEIYYSEFNSYISMYDCELIGNTFNNGVNIQDGTYAGETKIFANKFERTNCSNLLNLDTRRNAHIANNYFMANPNSNCYSNSYFINVNCDSDQVEVLFENNVFRRGGESNYTYSNYASNSAIIFTNGIISVRNNYFKFLQSSYSNYEVYTAQGISCSSVAVYSFTYNIVSLYDYNQSTISTLENGGYMGIGDISTIENNYYQLPTISTVPETLGYITSVSDLGSPDASCRDIDNTVNNIGTYGGPHSWENYHSTSISRAQILDLEIPYYQVILPGVELQFNSKAINKNIPAQ